MSFHLVAGVDFPSRLPTATAPFFLLGRDAADGFHRGFEAGAGGGQRGVRVGEGQDGPTGGERHTDFLGSLGAVCRCSDSTAG